MKVNSFFASFVCLFLLTAQAKADATMTEEIFNQAIDQVTEIIRPLVEHHGGKLVVTKKWAIPKENASTDQRFGIWSVSIYGGLGRYPTVTPDVLQLTVCHELGHHLGGFPFADYGDWSASEGQADGYAVQVCLPMVWGPQKEENAKFRSRVDPYAKSLCDQSWKDSDRRDLCYRISIASYNMALFLADGNEFPVEGNPPLAFNTPDPAQVDSIDGYGHVSGQCRLDTFFQASLCDAPFDLFNIPGLGFPNGARGLDAEKEAAMNSCTALSNHTVGLRPRCWYKPRM